MASTVTVSSFDPTLETTNQQSGKNVLPSLRAKLCRLILRLSSSETTTDSDDSTLIVSSVLDPFFASLPEELDIDDERSDEDLQQQQQQQQNLGISPLVMACDKGNLECLLFLCDYLESQASNTETSVCCCAYLETIVGTPLEITPGAGNTPLHHATTEDASRTALGKNGHFCFVRALERIAVAQERLRKITTTKATATKEEQPTTNFILALGAAVNAHNDTPLMMAVANNVYVPRGENDKPVSSAGWFLKTWYSLAVDRSTETDRAQIHRALMSRNDDGDSVLNFAWHKGIEEVVVWLIGLDNNTANDTHTIPRIVTSADLASCRAQLSGMDRQWKTLTNTRTISQAQLERYEAERTAIETCAAAIEECIRERSERIANELLSGLGNNDDNSNQPRSSKKKKPKKKRTKPKPTLDTISISVEQDIVDDTTPNNKALHDVPIVTKLTNGRVAVRVSGHNDNDNDAANGGPSGTTPSDVSLSGTFRKRTMSLDETNQLLRDRYKHTTITTTTTSAASFDDTKQRFSSDADSVLSALCLDVNCLLYSHHGMALNLSPAQLDAVQQILEEQLQSVHKARAIQERRCKNGIGNP